MSVSNIRTTLTDVVTLQSITLVFYQLLVGPVVIGGGLGREDQGSIPRNCDWEGAVTT
jgi:hypothetical protein